MRVRSRELSRLGLLGIAGLLVLPSCASLSVVSHDQGPKDGVGYVGLASTMHRGNLGSVGITLVDDAGRAAGTISLSTGEDRGISLVALRPGVYRVARMRGYMPLSPPVTKDLTDRALTRPFIVKPGRIVFLGEFSATTFTRVGGARMTYNFGFRQVPVEVDVALARVRAAYPGLAALPAECLLCMPASDAERDVETPSQSAPTSDSTDAPTTAVPDPAE